MIPAGQRADCVYERWGLVDGPPRMLKSRCGQSFSRIRNVRRTLASLPGRCLRMSCSTSKRRPLLLTRLVLAVTAAAFAILVSLAGSHLHVGPDDDEACAVCTAFADKLHDAAPPNGVVRAFVAVHLVVATLPQPQRIGVAPTLPPPSCGPPIVA